MTQKLYVRKGGGAAGEFEVTDMVTVRKGAPIFQGDQPVIQMGRRAADGEASQGSFVLNDPAAEIHSDGYRLSPHALVTWTEDASGDELWLARGRVAPMESGRRAFGVGGDEVEWEVTINDNNMDLRGQAFTQNVDRPAETDIERILWLHDYTLNGTSSTAPHSRNSCTITADLDTNGHLISTAFDRTMPAHTYPAGTQPQDVIAHCADRSGKTYGVVIHHAGGSSHDCLWYVGALNNSTYRTDVKVSDQLADIDIDDPTAPVFPPIWDRGKGTLTENDDIVSGVVVIYSGTNDQPQFTFVHDVADEIEPYEYWVEAINDDKADDATEAANLADTYFTSHRAPGHRTHRFSIKMHTSQHALLNAGMSIQVKSAVIAGGADLGTYVWRRITELRWEPDPDPEWIWAHIDLEKVLRRRGHAFQPSATAAKPPDTGTPGTPPTAPTEDYRWSFDDRGGSLAGNLYEDGGSTYYWFNGSWQNGLPGGADWADAMFGAGFCIAGGSGSNVTPNLPITAGTDYTISFDAAKRLASQTGSFSIRWYAGATLISSETLTTSISTSKESFSFVRTAPATATTLRMTAGASVGGQTAFDNVVVEHGGSGGTAGTPSTSPVTSVGGTGEGSYSDSGQYVPVGSVLEHQYITEGGPYHDADQIAIDDLGSYYSGTEVEAALQQLGPLLSESANHLTKTGGEGHTVAIHSGVSGALTLDLADGNVHEVTLSGNWTPDATGFTAGEWCEGSVILHQDGTGGRTTTFTNFEEPTGGISLPTDADSTSGFGFGSLDGGTTIYVWAQGSSSSVTFGTPALTLGTANAAGSTDEAIRRDATILAFDATVPVTQAFGDTAATGSATVAARRDHVHGMPAAPTSSSSGADHVHIVDEQFSGDASATVFNLANEAVPETAIAYVAGTRTSVTVGGTLNDQITFGSAPASGTNNISVDYVAVAS